MQLHSNRRKHRGNLFDYIFWNKGRKLTHRIVGYHMRPIYNEMFNEELDADDAKHRVCNHTLRYMKLSEANKVSAVEGIY